MGDPYVFSPEQGFPTAPADRAIRRFALLAAMPSSMVAPASEWWRKYTREAPGATVKTDMWIPLNVPQVHEGSDIVFQRMSEIFWPVTRGEATIAVEVDLQKAMEADFGAWAMTPEMMRIAIAKRPGRKLGALLNAAHVTLDWTGTYFAATTAIKPVHPKKSVGSAWLNAYENSALTGPNITRAIENLQSRRGLDNYPLGFGGRGPNLTLQVPSGMEEKARNLVEVMALVPDTNGTETGGGNTSRVLGRCTVEMNPDMRSDMWCLADAAAQGTGYEIMARVLGSGEGTPEVNDNIIPNGGEPGVPYLEPLIWTTDSDKYKDTGMLGAGYRIREGFSLLSPHAIVFNYTGAKDASYTV